MTRPWPPLPDRLLTDENRDAVRVLAFAIAYGMQVIAVRLAPTVVAKALADGASSAPNLDADWVLLDAFASNAQTWIQRAYAS